MKLKVLTFNIHKGVNITSSKLILQAISDLLRELDADIVFLQEVQGEHEKRSNKFADWPEQIQSEFLAGDVWSYHCYGQNSTYKHGHHGNAILSKYPLSKIRNRDISVNRFSIRGLLCAQVTLENFIQPVHVICAHFGLLNNERRKQFELLNNLILNEIPLEEPILIAGDFNDWQLKSQQLIDEAIGLQEVFHEFHGEHAKSFPAKKPFLMVDRIYYRGLELLHCKTIHATHLSDHLPLFAEFRLC